MRVMVMRFLLLASLVSLVPACAPVSDTGTAAVQITFEAPMPNGGLRGVLSGVVDTIRVVVSVQGKQLVSTDLGYEALEGTVSDIPAGSGRVFDVQALSAGAIVYAGRSTDVTIQSGVTQAVPVTLTPAYTTDTYAPARIVDLAAQAQGAEVLLTWTAAGDDGLVGQAASYDLRWSESTLQESNFAQATAVAGTPAAAVSGSAESFVVSGLTPNGTYHFALKAVDDDGNGALMSNEAIVTLGAGDSVAPARIMDLAVADVGETSITLSWTAPGDDDNVGTVSSYDLRYSTQPIDDSNFDSADQAQGPTTPVPASQQETVEVTGLTTGTAYYFAIKAADEVPNWSLRSSMVSATPEDLLDPGAVVDLAVSETTDESATLTWTAPGDDGDQGTVTSYEIRYSLQVIDADNFASATLFAGAPTPQAAGASESVLIPSLTSVQYTFALISYDNGGNVSALSNVVTAIPGQQDSIAPDDVTDLAVGGVTESSIILTFTAPGDDGSIGTVSAYDLRYHSAEITDAGVYASATLYTWPVATAMVSGGQQQTVEVIGLTAGQTYYFALAAVDDQGNASGLSNSPSGVPTDTVDPGPVTDLAVPIVADDQATLTWTAPGDDGAVGTVDHYEIRYSDALIDASNFASATIFASPPTPLEAGQQQTVDVTGLLTGTQYWFALVAFDEVGLVSVLSNVPSAIPGSQDTTAPGAVIDLTVTSTTASSAFLSWTAPGDDGATGTVTSYDVRYGPTAIASDVEFTAATPFAWPGGTTIEGGGAAQTLEVTGLTAGQTYHFALKATDNSNNESALSNSPSGFVDGSAPDVVSDLAITDIGDDYITLTWTAPADDGPSGDADQYGIYYHDQAFTDHLLATEWATPPTPAAAGQTDTVTINGLTPGATYFVRLRAADSLPNWSALSNEETTTLSCSLCPVLTSLRPVGAPAGAIVKIDGSQFGAAQGASTLTLGGLDATVLSWSDTLISALVPAASGPVDVVVTTAEGPDSMAFQVSPYVDSLTPGTTTVSSDVTLDGSGFGATQGSSTISFFASSSTPSVTSWSDTQIVVTVPADALTGPVFVSVDGYDSNTPLLTLTGAGERVWGATTTIRSSTNLCFLGRMDSDPQGKVQLVWSEQDGGGIEQAWGLVNEGAGWSATPVQISLSSVAPVYFAEVIALGADSFLTLFEMEAASTNAAVGYDASWSAIEDVGAAEDCWMTPAKGVLPDGTVVAAWPSGTGDVIYFNTRSPAGVWGTVSQPFPALGTTADVSGAVDPSGDFHIIWADNSQIYHAVYSGGSWSTASAVDGTVSASNMVFLDLVADSLGVLHAVWWDDGSYLYSSYDGAIWSIPSPLPGTGASTQGLFELDVDGADQLHAVVEDDVTGTDYEIYYSRKPHGGAWTTATNLSSDVAEQRFPGIVITPGMQMHVVWTEDLLSLLGTSWE